jgi:hypothetical protein
MRTLQGGIIGSALIALGLALFGIFLWLLKSVVSLQFLADFLGCLAWPRPEELRDAALSSVLRR